MDNEQIQSTPLDIRKTEFTMLKEEQCSLNMQVRLAMQLHDACTQTELEKKLKEITEQLKWYVR